MRLENNEQTSGDVVGMAFDHVYELAVLLQRSGRAEAAALLHAMGDIRELSERRARQGEAKIIANECPTTSYVLSQMEDLASLMDQLGRRDLAVLFRMPGEIGQAHEEMVQAPMLALRSFSQRRAV
jgi:hypothetical protein